MSGKDSDNKQPWLVPISVAIIGAISAIAVAWISKPQQTSSSTSVQAASVIPSPQSAESGFSKPSELTSEPSRISQSGTTRYSELESLLREGRWGAADTTTLRIILRSAGREQEGRLDVNSIQTLPCPDLLEIDRLWMKYSDSRFGFSIQEQLYSSNSGDPNDESWRNSFGEQVGWRVRGSWISEPSLASSREVPKGHLPFEIWRTWGGGFGWIPPFVEKLRTCQSQGERAIQ